MRTEEGVNGGIKTVLVNLFFLFLSLSWTGGGLNGETMNAGRTQEDSMSGAEWRDLTLNISGRMAWETTCCPRKKRPCSGSFLPKGTALKNRDYRLKTVRLMLNGKEHSRERQP